MKAITMKTFTSVHTWTGLGAGLLLFIAFYTGAMTVFFHELEEWDSFSAVETQAQSYAQAQELVDRVLAVDPDAAESFRVYPSSDDHPGNVLRWFERMEDGTFETHQYRLTKDGELNTQADNAHLAGFIYRLHYTAGLPASFGLYVLGIICLIYGIAIVSGLIIFIPNFLKDLFVVRKGKNKKRFWLDTHNVVGVISLPWHFMFAWSSALLGIGIFILAPFQLLVFEEDLLELIGSELGFDAPLEATGEPAALLPFSEIMAAVAREAPDLAASQVRYSNAGDSNAMVTVYGKVDAGTLSSNATVALNASTGELLGVDHPSDASIGGTLYSGLISLHFVDFGGFIAKWVYFFLGLAGAYLFYSGNLLWVESRRKRRRVKQPATGYFLARLNTGVCVGCMAGVSAAFLASRGVADWSNRAEVTELAYFGVFFASILWAYLRSVADGARDLLYLAAVLTAAIPVVDAVLIDMPIWRSLAAGNWPLFTVDCLAIVGAAAFWRMARAVQRRAGAGEPHSVWANSPRAPDNTPEPGEPASQPLKSRAL
ncbi:MAG: PepSY-associated TM helix domain-containing protein [Pseudomonadota bacterium]